ATSAHDRRRARRADPVRGLSTARFSKLDICALATVAAKSMEAIMQDRPETAQTTKIDTEYLMTLHAPGAAPPQQIDSSLIIYQSGADGWARGPKINGTLVRPTADWLHVMPSGCLRVDARMTIRTDDGALIYVSYNGVISVTQKNFEWMSKGDTLT